MPQLDIRTALAGHVTGAEMMRTVLLAYADELVSLVDDLLFSTRDDRVYTEWTYTKCFEEDLFLLRRMLVPANGYPSGQHEIKLQRIKNIAMVLMPLPSRVLVENYEKSLVAEGPRGTNDPSQPKTAVNIRRVLLKRNDGDSKAFKKKYKLAKKR